MKTKTFSLTRRLSGGASLDERGHSCPRPQGFHSHPGGMLDNGQTFQRWVREVRAVPVPKGRLKPGDLSAVPSGRVVLRAPVPNVKTLGYYRMSLRDKV